MMLEQGLAVALELLQDSEGIYGTESRWKVCGELIRQAIQHPEVLYFNLKDEIRQALQTIALVPTDSRLRREATLALGWWGNEESAHILVELAKDDDENIRRTYAFICGLLGGQEALESLCWSAENDGSEAVRYEAIDALAHSRFLAKHHWDAESEQLVRQSLRQVADRIGEKRYLRGMAEYLLKSL